MSSDDFWSQGQGYIPALDVNTASICDIDDGIIDRKRTQRAHGSTSATRFRQQQRSSMPQEEGASLKTLCLRCLAPYVSDIASMEFAGYLQPDIKGALVAMSRRRGELTDDVLRTLADPAWTQLDLAGCTTLKTATLLAVLRRVPALRALDLQDCRVTSQLVRMLPVLCPQLQVLRLRGSYAAATQQSDWASAAPGARAERQEPADWEEAAASDAPTGLSQLAWLSWPDVPPAIAVWLSSSWPKVHVNADVRRTRGGDLLLASDGRVRAGRVPEAADPAVALDGAWLKGIGTGAWRGEGAGQRAAPHIAERFWAAVLEVEEKKRARLEREYRQQLKVDTLEARVLGMDKAPPQRRGKDAHGVLEDWLDSY